MRWDTNGAPLIDADKVEQHIHTFPPESAVAWRGFLTGFGLTCGFGAAIAMGKVAEFIVHAVGL